MSDNTNDPILPIPSDLYLEMGELADQVDNLRNKLRKLDNRYRELRRAPAALDVDTLGKFITPEAAIDLTQGWLAAADENLSGASEEIGRAHGHASRLKLTDQAAEEREQRLTQRRPPIERTR